MKTTYLNPFNQNALQILQSYGNITQITETTQKINKVIETTHNQDKKHVNTIKELCYEKIRYYYQDQTHTNNNSYNYLFQEALEEADIISTHTTTGNSNNIWSRKPRSRHNSKHDKKHDQTKNTQNTQQ